MNPILITYYDLPCVVMWSLLTVDYDLYRAPVQKFVMDSQCSDCLLVGFSNERANPFREKSWSCQII